MLHTGRGRSPGRLRRVVLPLVVTAALTACTAEAPDAAPASPPSPSSAASASLSPSPPPSPSDLPDPEPPAGPLVWTGCGGGFECSTLPVRLDADDPAAGTLDLALVRRPATSPGRRVGSLVVNPGGPGASAVDYLRRAYGSLPEDVRAAFDVVAFDPRGVGRSAGVECLPDAQLDDYFAIDPEPDDAGELQALLEGNARLAAGCLERSGRVLPHVATVEVARDLDRVREALGDERLTYLGYSYGTSIGAAYLDRYPDRVRAMVLDGAVDPTLTWDQLLGGQARGFDAALQAFLADCERTRCAFRAAVQGDLTAAFDRIAERVERDPLPGGDGRTVGPGELSLGAGAGLYSRASGWPALAQGLAQAVRGDGTTLLALSDSYLERDPDGSYAGVVEGNLAVNCLDRPWPEGTAPYEALADQVRADAPRFGPAIALAGLACADWPVEPVGRPHPVTAEGAPPVVVIGTTGDPATPYAWSVALADQLSSGVLLTYRGDGHTVYRAGAPRCVREPVDRYLITGEAPAPATC